MWVGITISAAQTLAGFAVGYLGVHVTMHSLSSKQQKLVKIGLVVLGTIAVVLAVVQGVRNYRQDGKIDRLYSLVAGHELTSRQKAIVNHLLDLRAQGVDISTHLLARRATHAETQQKIQAIQNWIRDITNYVRERMGQHAADQLPDINSPTNGYSSINDDEYNRNQVWLNHTIQNLDGLIRNFQTFDDPKSDIYDGKS